MQQIVFIMNEVIWSDVAKVTFKMFDSETDISVKGLSGKVCYDGKHIFVDL